MITKDLETAGVGVHAGFFTPDECARMRTEIDGLDMKRAGISSQREVRDEIRRDFIHWLEVLPPRLEELRVELNRELFLGLRSVEAHYALYPPGGFYQRHLDSFRDDDARMVSFILYLNENWQPAHGGELRLYLPDGPRDIPPVGGTLICFLSREIEHEVLVSHAPRYSLTGWFKT